MFKKNVWAAVTAGLLAILSPALADNVMSPYTLYGVNGQTGELVSYSFSNNLFEPVGNVWMEGVGNIYDIQGMAYIPEHMNTIGFWTNPGDGVTQMVYVNCQTAKATVVGPGLGLGQVTGATITGLDAQDNLDATFNGIVTKDTNAGVFALQTIAGDESVNINFTNNGNSVTPTEPFAVKVSVLGAAISAGGSYDLPVTLKVKLGGTWVKPFGSFGSWSSGDVNDANNPRRYISPNLYPAGSNVSIKARSWIKTGGNSFRSYLTVSTSSHSSNVKVLKNGDPVPSIPAFLNQNSILDFIIDYVDPTSNTVVLDENQAIFLFELGTTNLNSPAADFQDLVVLVTFANDPSELHVNDDDDNLNGQSSRLVKVNHITGGYEQMMTLDRQYDGLAAGPNGVFFATAGQQLFKLDPLNQVETLLGPTAYPNITGFEAAGTTFCGFTSNAGVLTAVDVQTGQQIGQSVNLGVSDLQTIIFMSHPISNSNFD